MQNITVGETVNKYDEKLAVVQDLMPTKGSVISRVADRIREERKGTPGEIGIQGAYQIARRVAKGITKDYKVLEYLYEELNEYLEARRKIEKIKL